MHRPSPGLSLGRLGLEVAVNGPEIVSLSHWGRSGSGEQPVGPKPYKFIGFGDMHGPKPYKFIRFGCILGTTFFGRSECMSSRCQSAYPRFRNGASGPETGLPAWISAGQVGSLILGPPAGLEVFPNRIRRKSGAGDRFPARKRYYLYYSSMDVTRPY